MLERDTVEYARHYNNQLYKLIPKYKEARKNVMILLITKNNKLNTTDFPYEWLQDHINKSTLMKIPINNFFGIATISSRYMNIKENKPILKLAELHLDRQSVRLNIINHIINMESEKEHFKKKNDLKCLSIDGLHDILHKAGVQGIDSIDDFNILIQLIEKISPIKFLISNSRRSAIILKYNKLSDLDLIHAVEKLIDVDEKKLFEKDVYSLFHLRRNITSHREKITKYLSNHWNEIPPNLVKGLTPNKMKSNISDAKFGQIIDSFRNFRNLHPDGLGTKSPYAITVNVKKKRNISKVGA